MRPEKYKEVAILLSCKDDLNPDADVRVVFSSPDGSHVLTPEEVLNSAVGKLVMKIANLLLDEGGKIVSRNVSA